MAWRRLPLLMTSVVATSVLTGCGSRPCCTEFLTVVPVRYVAPSAAPNSVFGWVEEDRDRASAFRVLFGNKQYFGLLDTVGEERIVDELARYAEAEVKRQGFCPIGIAITKNKGIYGPYTGEYVALIVECHEAKT
jgi:hypothetical protein